MKKGIVSNPFWKRMLSLAAIVIGLALGGAALSSCGRDPFIGGGVGGRLTNAEP